MRSLLAAARFLLGLAVRDGRRRLVIAVVLLLVGYLSLPGVALALRGLTDAVIGGEVVAATWLAAVIAVLLLFDLMMGHFAHLFYFECGELAEAALLDDLFKTVNGTIDLTRLDSPRFADTLLLVREELPRTRAALESVLQLGCLALQSLVTTVILGTLNPWLVLLPLAAVPPVLIGRRAQDLVERAQERSAGRIHLSRHLFALATTTASIKELRLSGAEREIERRQNEAWTATSDALWRAQLRGAWLRGAGQLAFTLAYGGAVLIVVAQAAAGRSGLGDVVLIIALAVQVSGQVATALGLLSGLQSTARNIERVAALRAWPAGPAADGDRPAPDRLTSGIRLEDVAFRYPGVDRDVLDGVNLEIPAGGTVALVGENGAGKSTLVKLLCGMYQPTRGRILVDGVDLRELSPEAWCSRVAPLFQDFARLELLVRENVGAGSLGSMDDDGAVGAAVGQAGAEEVVRRMPGGLDGLLGRGYGEGTELSGGQWQKLGLARALIRPEPLLLVLDEPAAALDAAAENALFERFVARTGRARAASSAVTLFVSHRFSTVRLADQIVVLDGGRILESGAHEELMRRDGLYAELFTLQAGAHR